MSRSKSVRLIGLLMLLVAVAALAGCSAQQFISKEPTPYTVATANASGKDDIRYLTADHPEVKSVTPIAKDFVRLDQTQDYHSPNWQVLKKLASDQLIADREKYTAEILTRNSIVVKFNDFQITGIVFRTKSDEIFMATVNAELQVTYSSVDERYAKLNEVALNKPARLVVTLDLKKQTDDSWLVTSAEYQHVAVFGS